MIANFKKKPFIWSIIAFVILMAVGGFVLTDAQVSSQQTNLPDFQPSDSSNGKIQNISILQ